MKNKIDRADFQFINVAFIQKTSLRIASSIDLDGKKSLLHLQNIVESDKPMIKTLCLEHATVEHTYKNVTNVVISNKRVLEFHFIWARMILEFYYFYHDTKDETLKVAENMLAFEGFVYIKDAIREGIKLIDEYFEKEWNESIQDIQITKKPNQKLVQNPDILQLMLDINSGNIRYQDIDWDYQLKQLLSLCRLMPQKFPDVILVWGIVSIVDDPTTKMDIISRLQEAAQNCFNSPSDKQDFLDSCQCIYRVCMQARAYNLRNDLSHGQVWTDGRKELNDLAHIFCDEMVDAKWMVGMVEEMQRSECENRRHPLLEIVLKANRNIGQLSVDNIVDFAKKLYIAEGFRQMILSGQEDYRDIPTLEKFDWRLRNKCFDVYIDLRKERIKEFLNQDNTRVEGADDFEALQYMLEDEKSIVLKENGLEAFKGSPAYNALWYPGRKIILDMINVFIQYLPNQIEKMRKAEIAKLGGLHVDHIENFAMGDNVQTKIVKDHD